MRRQSKKAAAVTVTAATVATAAAIAAIIARAITAAGDIARREVMGTQ